jgi:hypothetical protein
VAIGMELAATLGNLARPGSVSAANSDKCVAVNGEVRMEQGTSSTCFASEGALALAIGNDNTAMADGDGNVVRIRGNGNWAEQSFGSDNTATVTGDENDVYVGEGDGNLATVTGDRNSVYALDGDGNRATATGDGNFVLAGYGHDNTATATGGCTAIATGGGDTDSCSNPWGASADRSAAKEAGEPLVECQRLVFSVPCLGGAFVGVHRRNATKRPTQVITLPAKRLTEERGSRERQSTFDHHFQIVVTALPSAT